MAAPFRIRKVFTLATDASVPRGGEALAEPVYVQNWMERLIKLIPGEVLVVYLAGKGYAASWLGIWALVCLVLVFVIRAWGTKDRGTSIQWPAVAVSVVSFVLWIYAMGGQFLNLQLPNPGIASAAVLVWTAVIPIFYKGD